MTIMGAAINGIGIFAAGILGALIKKGMPERIKDSLMTGLGLCVLYSGAIGFSSDTDLLVLTVSVALGVIIGEALDFDGHLNRFGSFIERKVSSRDNNFADGFVSASLFVCVGAMAIVGAIESGTKGTYNTYLAKSFIDILIVFLMATTKGPGCAFAGIVCFIYEALLTLGSGFIASIVNETVLSQMSQVGSLLVVAISLNLLNITHIKVASFLLAPFVPVLIYEVGKLF